MAFHNPKTATCAFCKKIYKHIMSRKKGLNKSKVGFSVDIQIVEELDEYCKDNYTNKSRLVNDLIKKFLESKNTQENGR